MLSQLFKLLLELWIWSGLWLWICLELRLGSWLLVGSVRDQVASHNRLAGHCRSYCSDPLPAALGPLDALGQSHTHVQSVLMSERHQAQVRVLHADLVQCMELESVKYRSDTLPNTYQQFTVLQCSRWHG